MLVAIALVSCVMSSCAAHWLVELRTGGVSVAMSLVLVMPNSQYLRCC